MLPSRSTTATDTRSLCLRASSRAAFAALVAASTDRCVVWVVCALATAAAGAAAGVGALAESAPKVPAARVAATAVPVRARAPRESFFIRCLLLLGDVLCFKPTVGVRPRGSTDRAHHRRRTAEHQIIRSVDPAVGASTDNEGIRAGPGSVDPSAYSAGTRGNGAARLMRRAREQNGAHGVRTASRDLAGSRP